MFENAFGTATLDVQGKSIPLRIALNPSNNTILCSHNNQRIADRNSFFDSEVTLLDVEFFGDGIKWTTPAIEKLMILKVSGGGWGVAESEIGEITAQNDYRSTFTVTKNGQHEFELDKEFDRSFEFSGGLPTAEKVEILEGVFFYSDGQRSSVFGPKCSELVQSDLLPALSLACGCVMRPRFEVSGKSLTMTFWQSLDTVKSQPLFDNATDGYVDYSKRSENLCKVYMAASKVLDDKPRDETAPIRKLIILFLHCRQMTNVLDIQILSLFSFLEVIDGSGTLNGNTLAPLLKVEIDMAKELKKVRNGVSHGTHSLSEAIEKFIDLDRDEYQQFKIHKDGEMSPTTTFVNFFHSRCNQVFLDMIGAQVDEARPYTK